MALHGWKKKALSKAAKIPIHHFARRSGLLPGFVGRCTNHAVKPAMFWQYLVEERAAGPCKPY